MGHIGYTPQNKKLFRPHGMKSSEQKKLINEAIKIKSTNLINESIIPVIWIGESLEEKKSRKCHIHTFQH